MNIDSNLNFDSGISANKKDIRQAAKQKYHIKQRLDSINEQKWLDRQLNSFSDYWDM